MWHTEVRIESKASREHIWQLWKDVEHWNRWDKSVEYSTIEGEFTAGTKGTLKPKGGPKTKFRITESIEERCFINVSKLPLCTIKFIHQIDNLGNRIAVTHRIEIRGPLSSFFSRIMGKNIKKELPIAVNNLIEIAENE